jgi:hypothetical protein
MLDAGRPSGQPNSETGASGELSAIVGWLRKLPEQEVRALRAALADHDTAKLSACFANFQDLEGHSHGAR